MGLLSGLFGSGPKAPPPPDPYRVAGAQTDLNRDTAAYNAALNRVNTTTPFGSQSYRITGTDPSTGAPIYEQNISLDPQLQALYNERFGQQATVQGITADMLASLPRGGVDTSGLPALQGNIDMSGAPAFSFNPQGGDLQRNLNTSGLPELQTDVSQMRQGAQDALYARNTEYLNPQFQRDEQALRSRLANQGIVEGSEAYQNAMQDFDRSKEIAYRQARNESIAGAGTEASRLFDIGSRARGQMFGEELAGGQFQNLAQGQAYGQSANNAQMQNQSRAQMLAEMLGQGQFANSARQQGFGERLTNQTLPFDQYLAMSGSNNLDMPQFDSMPTVATQPADITGPMYQQYQALVDNYNARAQSRNNLMGGLFGLGSAAILANALEAA